MILKPANYWERDMTSKLLFPINILLVDRGEAQ